MVTTSCQYSQLFLAYIVSQSLLDRRAATHAVVINDASPMSRSTRRQSLHNAIISPSLFSTARCDATIDVLSRVIFILMNIMQEFSTITQARVASSGTHHLASRPRYNIYTAGQVEERAVDWLAQRGIFIISLYGNTSRRNMRH